MGELSDLFPPPPPLDFVTPGLSVGFILTPRFTLLPFASLIDCLRHAADEADHSRQIYCRWKVVGPTLERVRASCGVELVPECRFPDPREFDYVVVAGGQLPWCMDVPEATLDYLRAAQKAGVGLIGICTGSFVLAKAGLLDGHRCAVHNEHRLQLEVLFPKVIAQTDQVYISDGGIITCPGGTAALDLATTLVTLHCGKSRAIKSLTSLLVEKHRSAYLMPTRSFAQLAACGDETVEQAIEIMERHISSPFSIAMLAARLNVSAREVSRGFADVAGLAPTAVWRRIRLDHARWMLLNSNRSVTQIALETGFADGAHFSRWFSRTFNVSPAAFRKRHRPRAAAAEETL